MRGTAEGAAWDDDVWKLEAADAAPPHSRQIKRHGANLARVPVVWPVCCVDTVRVVFGFFR